MNEQDLHDILEAINAKQQTYAAFEELAQNLATFRKALMRNGFSNWESMYLTTQWMDKMLKMNLGG